MKQFEQKPFYNVALCQLEDLLMENFGFSEVHMDEMSNDSVFTIEVSGTFEDEAIKEAIETDGALRDWDLETLMCKLCKNKLVPAGDYIIRYSW